jgi:hypothetical protein
MAKYNYGKTFKKDGKTVRYRYTDKDPKSKKLVPAKKPRASASVSRRKKSTASKRRTSKK